ncbi:MAG: hypothetical protein, partial [Olavius algarvensis Gamma 3 endosymbiont]
QRIRKTSTRYCPGTLTCQNRPPI